MKSLHPFHTGQKKPHEHPVTSGFCLQWHSFPGQMTLQQSQVFISYSSEQQKWTHDTQMNTLMLARAAFYCCLFSATFVECDAPEKKTERQTRLLANTYFQLVCIKNLHIRARLGAKMVLLTHFCLTVMRCDAAYLSVCLHYAQAGWFLALFTPVTCSCYVMLSMSGQRVQLSDDVHDRWRVQRLYRAASMNRTIPTADWKWK